MVKVSDIQGFRSRRRSPRSSFVRRDQALELSRRVCAYARAHFLSFPKDLSLSYGITSDEHNLAAVINVKDHLKLNKGLRSRMAKVILEQAEATVRDILPLYDVTCGYNLGVNIYIEKVGIRINIVLYDKEGKI